MVWYNFMYHLDRQIDLHPMLQAWATDIARPHLSQIDPSFLRIDTPQHTWKQLLLTQQIQREDDESNWTQVGNSKLSSKKKSSGALLKSALKANPKHPRIRPAQPTTGPPATLSQLSSLRSSPVKPRPSNSPVQHGTPPPTDSQVPPSPAPAWVKPPEIFNPPSDADSDMSEAKQSAFTASMNAATNDGTHRLTLR